MDSGCIDKREGDANIVDNDEFLNANCNNLHSSNEVSVDNEQSLNIADAKKIDEDSALDSDKTSFIESNKIDDCVDNKQCVTSADNEVTISDVIVTASLNTNEVQTITNGSVEVKVDNVDSELNAKSSDSSKREDLIVKSTCSSAFTKFQDCGSGTEDSQSDSEDSSSSESSDESSSSEKSLSKESSSSDDDEQDVVKKPVKPRNDGGAKAGANKQNKKMGVLYKGEMGLEDLPPIEDLHITVPEEECEPLGTICSIVNQLVVIESLPNKPALNLDSLLFKKDGECLGQIFDVFGPVKSPFYSLRFNNNQEITDKGITVGQTVYCAPQTPHTKYVFVYQLMQQKGSDASWKHNYEVPSTMVDYSDDEEEKKAKRKNHQKARGRPNGKHCDGESPQKKRSGNSGYGQNFNQHTGNEWYQARVSELNQFNKFNRNQQSHQDRSDLVPNRRNSFGENSSCRIQDDSMASFCVPPQLLRPPTPLSWNAPQNQFPLSNNFRPKFTPPYIVNNQNIPCPESVSFSPAQPFAPPHFSYEGLNSPVHFSNPVSPYPDRLTPPVLPFQLQVGSIPPNRRPRNPTAPRPHLPSPLLRPNISFHNSRFVSSPSSLNQEHLQRQPNYFNQPHPNH